MLTIVLFSGKKLILPVVFLLVPLVALGVQVEVFVESCIWEEKWLHGSNTTGSEVK